MLAFQLRRDELEPGIAFLRSRPIVGDLVTLDCAQGRIEQRHSGLRDLEGGG